ncbi:MAG: flagellin [Thermoplasmata archaeon]|jgi:flagellin FlaB|nr:flagellin [Thermoplasmata archaeon]
MEKIRKPRLARMEDAEMGVGTLLIFIAMILVAAVAAGVLVQTAYSLQQQAETTGDQALQEVATGIKVITVYGMTTADPVTGALTITDLYFKVSLSAGSPVINLIHLIVEITDGYDDESLSYSDVASAAGTFDASQIRDTYPYNTWTATDVGVTQGDIALLHIDLTAQGGDMSLTIQQDFQGLLIPKHGIPTFVMFTTPSVLANTYETLN